MRDCDGAKLAEYLLGWNDNPVESLFMELHLKHCWVCQCLRDDIQASLLSYELKEGVAVQQLPRPPVEAN